MKAIDKFLDTVIGMREEKREYKQFKKKINELPKDYRIVLEQIEKYMWNFAADGSMMQVLYEIYNMFEDAIEEGKEVLDVTGEDVVAFTEGVMSALDVKRWDSKIKDKLNNKVSKKISK